MHKMSIDFTCDVYIGNFFFLLSFIDKFKILYKNFFNIYFINSVTCLCLKPPVQCTELTCSRYVFLSASFATILSKKRSVSASCIAIFVCFILKEESIFAIFASSSLWFTSSAVNKDV